MLQSKKTWNPPGFFLENTVKKKHLFLAKIVLLFALSMPSFADVLLDSFEGGHWNPEWQTIFYDDLHQDPERFTTATSFNPIGDGETFLPKDGAGFGVVETGLFRYLSLRVLDFWVVNPSTFTMQAGVSFGDYLPFNDYVWITLVDYATYTTQLQFITSVKSVGDFGTVDWVQLTSEVLPGKYRLSVNAWNNGDDADQSYLLLDSIRLLPHSVPEPTTFALLLVGLLSIMSFGYRSRRPN